jgi:hypothetical protein
MPQLYKIAFDFCKLQKGYAVPARKAGKAIVTNFWRPKLQKKGALSDCLCYQCFIKAGFYQEALKSPAPAQDRPCSALSPVRSVTEE